MEVTVKFFSYCRVVAGTDQLRTEIPEGATIADLMDKLRRTLGNPDIGKDQTNYMVNSKHAALDTTLNDNDEIILLYIIGGG